MATSKQFGSNAAKLSDYLKANESQVADFGKQVAGGLSDNYNKTMGDINQGFGDFSQQVDKGYAHANDDLVNRAASDPTSFVKDPENVKSFQSLYNNQYSGPQNFESSDGYANINDEVNKATQTAGLVNNFSGLSTYLNNTGKGGMTPGMNTLNTALLQRSPEATKAIKDAAEPFQNLGTYLNGKTSEADQQVSGAKTNADQIRQNVQNRFSGESGVIPSFQKDLNDRVAQARQTASQRSANAKSLLTSNAMPDMNTSYDPQQLADLGLSKDEMNTFLNGKSVLGRYGNLLDPATNQPYYQGNFDPTQFGTEISPESAITSSNLATNDDYAKAAALSQLSGQDLTGILNQADIGSAGKANLDTYNFDKNSAQNSLSNAVRDQDSYILKESNGIDLNDPNSFEKSGMQGYFDALMNGKVSYSSNPVRAAQQKAAIQAAIRQGIYTPTPLVNDPTTGNTTLGPTAHI